MSVGQGLSSLKRLQKIATPLMYKRIAIAFVNLFAYICIAIKKTKT